jgi:hypothetical protein
MFKVRRRATFSSDYFFCSRSPGHHVPWWVLIWLKRSPLVFLVLSVSCFSIGLVFFSYSSRQVCFLLLIIPQVALPLALTRSDFRILLSLRSRRCSPHLAALDLSPFPCGSYLSAGSLFDTGAQNGSGIHWTIVGSSSPSSFLVIDYYQPCTAQVTL